jgi:hypothetical protein
MPENKFCACDVLSEEERNSMVSYVHNQTKTNKQKKRAQHFLTSFDLVLFS